MRASDTGGAMPGSTGFQRALDSLREAGVAFELRKASSSTEELPAEGELDIWLQPHVVARARSALAAAGFHPFEAPGHAGHRFYLAFEEGAWLKLDAKLIGNPGRSRPDPGGLSAMTRRISAALARRRFASLRRLGPVIAVLGPDGAGKGRLVARLERTIPVAVGTFYLGLSRKSDGRAPRVPPASHKGHSPETDPRSGRYRPSLRGVREPAYVVRKALRDWARLLPAYVAAWRGEIVLCDRHPIEVLAVKPERTRLAGEVERFLANRLTPRPDAIIVLDAPGAILYRRKREHTVELLERWRRGYREVFVPLGATVITTAGPPKVALARASEVVWAALVARRGW